MRDLIFLDESGANLRMAPLYGRAPGGKRVVDAVPFNRGNRLTMLSARGKVKTCLRKESARTLDKFAISIKVAFMSIQPTDLANWYRHCGYRTL
jgi:hypothetical protein